MTCYNTDGLRIVATNMRLLLKIMALFRAKQIITTAIHRYILCSVGHRYSCYFFRLAERRVLGSYSKFRHKSIQVWPSKLQISAPKISRSYLTLLTWDSLLLSAPIVRGLRLWHCSDTYPGIPPAVGIKPCKWSQPHGCKNVCVGIIHAKKPWDE